MTASESEPVRLKVAKGGAALVIRQTLSLPLNALGAIVVSHCLTTGDFGVQSILTPLATLSASLADMGTSQALVQAADLPSARGIRNLQILRIVGPSFLLALFFTFSSRIAEYFDAPTGLIPLLATCTLVGWLQSQRNYFAVPHQRALEWAQLAKIEISEVVVYNLAVAGLAYTLRSPWAFPLAQVIRFGLGSLALKLSAPAPGITYANHRTTLPAMLRFGLPLQITVLMGLLNAFVNPILVGRSLGLSASGLINWSMFFALLPVMLFQPLQTFLFSVLSERRRRGVREGKMLESIEFSGLYVVSFLTAQAWVAAPYLIRLCFHSKWEPAIPILRILLLSNISSIAASVAASRLLSTGRSARWMVTNIAGSAVLWLTTPLGLRAYGLKGFAYVWLGASIIALVILTITVWSRGGLGRLKAPLQMFASVAFTVLVTGRIFGDAVLGWGQLTLATVFSVLCFSGFSLLITRRQAQHHLLTTYRLLVRPSLQKLAL